MTNTLCTFVPHSISGPTGTLIPVHSLGSLEYRNNGNSKEFDNEYIWLAIFHRRHATEHLLVDYTLISIEMTLEHACYIAKKHTYFFAIDRNKDIHSSPKTEQGQANKYWNLERKENPWKNKDSLKKKHISPISNNNFLFFQTLKIVIS